MKTKLVIVGAGGHARSCIDAIESTGRFEIVGLVGGPDEIGREILGYPVIGRDDDLERIAGDCPNAVVGIGQIKTPGPRIAAFERLQRIGFQLPVVQASSAYVSPRCRIGAGTVVFHGAVINANVSVGVNCIINSRALLEHDARVGDHTHLSTGVVLNGQAAVGDRCFIGSGSLLREGIRVGDDSIVSMGSRVLSDLPAGARTIPDSRAPESSR